MVRASIPVGGRGPAVHAIDPWASSTGRMRQLLSDEERARLAVIASIVRFKRGAEIYREDHRADAIFNIISGVVRRIRRPAIPMSALRSRLSKDASLEFHVICKLCQELRQAQRHAFILARRQALLKVAMFLQLLEQLQVARGESTTEIYFPDEPV